MDNDIVNSANMNMYVFLKETNKFMLEFCSDGRIISRDYNVMRLCWLLI